ncbi:MAG: MgtC/SapB family protein [Treponema sp.]|nr:MgtC/SapB family protein [Treponema sp.]
MSNHITEFDMIIRLGLGFMAGAILGFERSSRHQVAGLRTHILISLGATLLMLLSIWIPQQFFDFKSGDPGRIAAQVVSGIGFLGAGAIIRLGNNIRGLTTAASLWFVAAVGMAVGAGLFFAAAIAEAVGLFTLLVLGKFERKIFPSERLQILEVTYNKSIPDTHQVMEILKVSKIRIQSVSIISGSKSKGSRLILMAGIPESLDIAQISQDIKTAEGVIKVAIKEK